MRIKKNVLTTKTKLVFLGVGLTIMLAAFYQKISAVEDRYYIHVEGAEDTVFYYYTQCEWVDDTDCKLHIKVVQVYDGKEEWMMQSFAVEQKKWKASLSGLTIIDSGNKTYSLTRDWLYMPSYMRWLIE